MSKLALPNGLSFAVSDESSSGSDSDVSSDEIEVSTSKAKATDHLCTCKTNLLLVEDGSFHTSSSYCNVCDQELKVTETFFHCPQERNQYHPEGFDVCARCMLTGKYVQQRKAKKKMAKKLKAKEEFKSRPIKKRVKAQTENVQQQVKSVFSKIIKKDEAPTFHRNYVDTANFRTTAESSKARSKLQKETEQKSKEIERLKSRLEAAEKEKKQADATLKSVKTQVTNLILKNEELVKTVKSSKKDIRETKAKSFAASPVVTVGSQQSSSDVKGLKKSAKKYQKKVDKHTKQIKKLEKVVSSMYQLFATRFDELAVQVAGIETRVNKMSKHFEPQESSKENEDPDNHHDQNSGLFDSETQSLENKSVINQSKNTEFESSDDESDSEDLDMFQDDEPTQSTVENVQSTQDEPNFDSIADPLSI